MLLLKKMYLKKKLVFGVGLLFIISSVAACSKGSESANSNSDNSSQNSSTQDNNTQDSSAQASNTVYGKVTKIDGNKITLALGDMAQGNMGAAPSGMPQGGGQDGKNGGQAPSGAPDKNGKSNGGQDGKSGGQAPSGAPGKGSGQAPSGMPQGGQPGNMGGGFTENGETKEITIDDESLIKVQSGNTQTQGSLDDITVDSILTVEYSDSNTISAILVHSNGQGAKPDSKSDSSSDSTK